MHKKLTSVLLSATFITGLFGCQPKYSHHEMTGTWRGTGHTINSKGKSLTQKFLVIQIDEDGLVDGTSGWELVTGSGGYDGEIPTVSASEEVIGVFDSDTGTLHLVEMREHGILTGQILDHDRIRMVLVQSGEKPVASTFILNRAAETSKTKD